MPGRTHRGSLARALVVAPLALLALATSPAHAAPLPLAPQDGGQLSVHIQQLVPNGANQLVAYVSVVGADGHPVAGLAADQVSLRVDGQPIPLQDVNEVTDVGQPITAAVLLDTSSTMGYGNKLPDAKAAISAFGQSLNTNDQVGFYQIAGDDLDGVHRLLDFTKDHNQLAATVNPLPAPGPGVKAPIYDALDEVAQDMASIPGRKLVILQTDMHDDGSKTYSQQQALELLQRVHLPVYTIGLGTDADLATLQSISQATGGTSFDYTDAASLSASYQSILSQFRDAYRLIAQTDNAFSIGKHEVQVQVDYQGQMYTDTASFVVPKTNISLHFSLHNHAQVSGSTNLKLDVAGDDLPMKTVVIMIDGKPFATEQSAGPHYAFPAWDTRYTLPGNHTLHITAVDIAGNTAALDVTVQVGVDWFYWGGMLLLLLVVLAAALVLRYASYRFRGSKLEGMLAVYNSAGQVAKIELGQDVQGSRLRLKIRPDGVYLGAHPTLKKFPFTGAARPQAKPPQPGGLKVSALLYTRTVRLEGSKVVVPYYYQKEKKKPLELNNGKTKQAGQYKVKFTEQ